MPQWSRFHDMWVSLHQHLGHLELTWQSCQLDLSRAETKSKRAPHDQLLGAWTSDNDLRKQERRPRQRPPAWGRGPVASSEPCSIGPVLRPLLGGLFSHTGNGNRNTKRGWERRKGDNRHKALSPVLDLAQKPFIIVLVVDVGFHIHFLELKYFYQEVKFPLDPVVHAMATPSSDPCSSGTFLDDAKGNAGLTQEGKTYGDIPKLRFLWLFYTKIIEASDWVYSVYLLLTSGFPHVLWTRRACSNLYGCFKHCSAFTSFINIRCSWAALSK